MIKPPDATNELLMLEDALEVGTTQHIFGGLGQEATTRVTTKVGYENQLTSFWR